MPIRSHASATGRMASMPALWPMARGRNRCRAHRLFPSMMIATCSGGGSGPLTDSDFHDLGFLAGGQLVDASDVSIGQLLQLVARAPRLVGRDLLLLLHRLDAVVLIAPDVPDRHVASLRVPLDQAYVLPATFFVERWDG